MSAPNGNRFWELRSKHGRDKLFDSPDAMWEAACEYFEWCVDNPLMEVEQVKNPGKPTKLPSEKVGDLVLPGEIVMPDLTVSLPKMRPFTMQGLCRFLDCDTSYFRVFKTSASKDFLTVITRIEETIYEQKFTGAASGFLNPNIIARDLGLIDKKDMSINADVTVEYTDGPDETEN